MLLTMLKSKIHRATITECSLHYEGSITIPVSLAQQANIAEYEKVLIANVDNGNRFDTYVIFGDDGKICLNGAAAHLGKPGDKIIIMAWATMDARAASNHTPTVVLVDDRNLAKH